MRPWITPTSAKLRLQRPRYQGHRIFVQKGPEHDGERPQALLVGVAERDRRGGLLDFSFELALVSGLHDMAALNQSIEKRGHHL
jgi:hypothetical protein